MRQASRPRPDARDVRFQFGANWLDYAAVIDEQRITAAKDHMLKMLGPHIFEGASFLDIGCGSGLSSLVARQLGARVLSFDNDLDSVRCTESLRSHYRPDDPAWDIRHGTILDASFLEGLGHWDVVYAWGVLHHTGSLWRALANAIDLVAPHGHIYLSIYNDQGLRSRMWRRVKRAYNTWPSPAPTALLLCTAAFFALKSLPRSATALLRTGQIPEAVPERGMSRWHDLRDWVGGYPYEVATPSEVFDFLSDRSFVLRKLVTRNGLGCNEFVFVRQMAEPAYSATR